MLIPIFIILFNYYFTTFKLYNNAFKNNTFNYNKNLYILLIFFNTFFNTFFYFYIKVFLIIILSTTTLILFSIP